MSHQITFTHVSNTYIHIDRSSLIHKIKLTLYCIPEAFLFLVMHFCRQEESALIPHPYSSKQLNQSSHAARTTDSIIAKHKANLLTSHICINSQLKLEHVKIQKLRMFIVKICLALTCQREIGNFILRKDRSSLALPRLPSLFSKSIGLTLWGIVEDPISPALVICSKFDQTNIYFFCNEDKFH